MRLREELDRELHLREQDLTLYQRILTDKLDESLWFARNSPFWLSIGIADVAGSTDKNVEARLLPLIDRVVKELSKEMGFEVVMMDRENNLFRFPLLPPSKVEFRAPVEELDSIEPSIAQLRFLWFLFSNPPISLKPRKTTIFEYHAVQIGEKSTNFVLIRPRYAIDRNLSEDEICYLLKRVTAQSFGRSYPHSGCLLGDKEATGVCSTCAFSFLRAKPARLFHGVSVL